MCRDKTLQHRHRAYHACAAFPVPRPPRMARQAKYFSTTIAQHLLDLLTQKDIDVQPILAAGGLSRECLDGKVAWLPLSTGRDMMLAALHETGNPHLGLVLARATFPSAHGLVGHLLQACTTLGEAIVMADRYSGLISNALHSPLLREGDACLWSVQFDDEDPAFAKAAIDFVVAARYRFLGLVNGDRRNYVRDIWFSFPAADGQHWPRIYEDVFHRPVQFDQKISGLLLEKQAVDLPLRHIDVGIKRILELEAEKQLSAHNEHTLFLINAKAGLAILLSQGRASRENLAASLDISSRQLHRGLLAAGTNYSSLLDAIRLDFAEKLLGSGASVTEISDKLGFGERTSFTRWYKAKTGNTVGTRKKR